MKISVERKEDITSFEELYKYTLFILKETEYPLYLKLSDEIKNNCIEFSSNGAHSLRTLSDDTEVIVAKELIVKV